ncbi:hypothetical protein [Streptomyces sp. SP18CS02]|uniref:hypothetical protein n=1 Tax=Streptomyces sp. SP18CS02 TaxID=3002531 RepID=UPI002E78DEE7|nr:hypothetical protein [Streptomyces sp. SP18CS02]MEE1753184.1 hypothetical protein [Streptomyces sp. SP18CS02]
MRFRRTALRPALRGAFAVLAAALLAAVPAPARAEAAPGFLGGADLPPAPGASWQADRVTGGLPAKAPFCLEKALPASGRSAWHRTFRTDLDTGAVQIVVTSQDTATARALAAAVEKAAVRCAAEWLGGTPGGSASWRDYGPITVEDGARVIGVHTSVPDSDPSVHLTGVGRDGRDVTIVQWGRMGDLVHAPVAAFEKTTVTAVRKLR